MSAYTVCGGDNKVQSYRATRQAAALPKFTADTCAGAGEPCQRVICRRYATAPRLGTLPRRDAVHGGPALSARTPGRGTGSDRHV